MTQINPPLQAGIAALADAINALFDAGMEPVVESCRGLAK